MKAHRSLPKLTEPSMVRAWMLRIVANEAKNHLRGRDRRHRRDERYGSWVLRRCPNRRPARSTARTRGGLGVGARADRCARSAGARLSLLRRTVGGRDRFRPLACRRHGQVENGAGAGATSSRDGATMIDLERSLGELADRLEIPGDEWLVSRRAPPDWRAAAQGAASHASRALPEPSSSSWFSLWAALPGPRRAVARWLGFDSVRIEPGVSVPRPSHRRRPRPRLPHFEWRLAVTAAITPPDLGLGAPVSIEEAMSQNRHFLIRHQPAGGTAIDPRRAPARRRADHRWSTRRPHSCRNLR